MIGTVLRRGFQKDKGYGFIESGGVSYFLHATKIIDEWLQFDEWLPEREVEFDPLQTPRGLTAVNVRAAA